MELIILAAVAAGLFAAGSYAQVREGGQRRGEGRGEPRGPRVTHAVAVLQPTKGNAVKGVVKLVQEEGKVKINAEVEGLKPNQKHAIHIHEFGDISSEDGMATGGHYNPEGHDHSLPDKAERHAGDLGNLQADAQGKAVLELTVDNITVTGRRNPVLGRAIIVHEKEDDGGQPTGNAGARIAQGIIGVAKAE
jgi:Cu-Zn family superoxide dismutase